MTYISLFSDFALYLESNLMYKHDTLEPRYNTVRYNTNSDITRMRVGPQFFPNLPFFISLDERKYVFQTC